MIYATIINAIKANQSTPAKDKAPIVFMIDSPVVLLVFKDIVQAQKDYDLDLYQGFVI